MSDETAEGMALLAHADRIEAMVMDTIREAPDDVLLAMMVVQKQCSGPDVMVDFASQQPTITHFGVMLYFLAASREYINRQLAKEREAQ